MTSTTGTKSDDTITTGATNDTIDGGNGNDTISSGAGNDRVDGGSGNDTIDAGSGDDTVDGGSGNDTISAGTGNDTVDGGSGNDTIDAGDGNDTVLGDSGDDVIRGGIGDDRLYGDSGNDSIDGGAGNDFIDGGAGQDKLFGGAGNDIIIGSTGADTIHGGEGDDVIGRMDDESRCSSSGENGTDVIYGDGYNSAANAGLAAALGNDTIYAGSGNDIIYGDNGNNLSGAGVGGNDRIYAGSGNDQVYGEGGDDTLYGEGGDDLLDGGAGNDTLNGGDGRDTVYGGLGNDTISGADGRDLLYGGSGDDRIGSNGDSGWRNGDQFESGGDTIYGDGKDSAAGPAAAPGADLIYSGRGNDIIYGDNGDNLSGNGVGGSDIIYAGSGNDIVYGEGGDDQLFGEKGHDKLHGGAGADELAGGLGADELTGGSGADTFVFTAAINQSDTHGVHHQHRHGYGHQRGHDHDNLLNWSDSTLGSMDVVTDFQGIKDLSAQDFTSGADKIDLVQLLGDGVDLKWGGTTPIANGVWFKHIEGDTYVYADINGNTTPELAVRLSGIHHLVVGDFLGVESLGPLASNDSNGSDLVIEAGGLANLLADDGAATGNVLANDTDPDLPFDTLAVSAVNGAAALVGAVVIGTYGKLTLNADGSYSYQLDNDDPQTQGLAQGVAAADVFTYAVTDSAGVTATATLTINITGTNDHAVISGYEAGTVVEDVATTASGTMLVTDVDSGEDVLQPVSADTHGDGGFGTFEVLANGSWTYSLDNDHAAVQALPEGGTLYDSLTVHSADGTASQVISITITGTNDDPVIESAVDSGAVTEEGTTTASGSIAFSDVDLSDGHNVSVLAGADDYLGSFTAGVVDAATDDGTGSVSWDFSVDNAALQFLAAGQSLQQSYTVTVADGHGGTASQVVTVTLTGTNDDPVIESAVDSGAVTEEGTTTASGSIVFSDVDLIDGHNVSVLAGADDYLGSFTAGVVDAATDDGTGSVSWDFSVDNAALQFLAAGQSLQQSYTVTVADGHGGTASQVVTVTLTGTNDDPVIESAVDSGAVTEEGTTTASGSIVFSDVDLIDGHNVSVLAGADDYLGSFTANVVDAATDDGAGSVSWDFSVNNAALQFLAAGQSLQQSYTVTVADGHGGTASQVVTVTLTGTNDDPVIESAVDSGAVTEEGTTTASGSIVFSDVDLSDGHNVSVLAGADDYLGSFTAGVVDAATDDGTGSVSWDFSVDNAALQFLAAGQSLQQSYTVTVADGHGGTASQVVTVTLTGTNDVPVISGVNSGTVAEDASTPNLTTSGALSISDPDSGQSSFVPQSNIAGSNGYGQFSIDAAGNWSYSANAAQAAIQALGVGASLTDSITVHSLDGSASRVVSVTIEGTNDAPVLNAAATPIGNAVLEDASAPVGAVGTLVSALVNFNPPSGGLDNVTDADAGALTGIAITNAETANGTWYYSLNGGGSWTALGTVSDAVARLLAADGDNRLYFQPAANFDGQASITFRAWDQTSGIDGGTSNTTANGGTTAFSTATDTAVFDVTPVNDVPTPQDDILISNWGKTSFTVPEWAFLTNDIDVDSGTLDILAVGIDSEFASLSHVAGVGTNGTISINDDNTAGGTFAYTVFDSGLASANANVQYIQDSKDIDGGSGNEIIVGDNGADTFNGRAGNDVLIGGNGSDSLRGGAGNDIYGFDLDDGNDTLSENGDAVSSGGGIDSIFIQANGAGLSNLEFIDSSTAVGGNLTFRFNGQQIAVTDHFTGASTAVVESVAFLGGAFYAGYNLGSSAYALSTDNSGNRDAVAGINTVLAGDSTANILNGNSGKDLLFGNEGADNLSGGDEDDLLLGGTGADALTGGNGADTFVINSGDSTITLGGSGNKGTISGYDVITDFDAAVDWLNMNEAPATAADISSAPGNDSDLTIGGSVISSHRIANGIMTFDDAVSFASALTLDSMEDVAAAVQYLQKNDIGSTNTVVAFNATINGTAHTFVYQQLSVNAAGTSTNNSLLVNLQSTTLNDLSSLVSNGHVAPAGIAGEPINLALPAPEEHVGLVTVSLSGVPAGWSISGGTDNGDGSWTVQTEDPRNLSVTTAASFAGALVLTVSMTWTNADGSTGFTSLLDNVEAYAPGSSIFALSSDDNLTGSSGDDQFVFAQPIAHNQIHSFDVASDRIDLIGFGDGLAFADLQIANDGQGNAVITLGEASTITLQGVDAGALGAANFVFDLEPETYNAGTLTVHDGAMLPLGGFLNNSGTVVLDSYGRETRLEVLADYLTLRGGGQLTLSDNEHNLIIGGASTVRLVNEDNTISGAGNLGGGQMTLSNAGTILANGANSLNLDTGANTIVNSGVLAATGVGGMTVESALDNTGHLWANGGDLRLMADVAGNGSATIDGDASLSFGGAAQAAVAFHGEGAGTLVVAHAEDAASLAVVLGLEQDDRLVFGDLGFGAGTQLSYSANAYGTGGLLAVDNGTQRAELNLLGHYSAADFQVSGAGEAGTLLSYNGSQGSGTLVGSMLADVLNGGDGDDILVGRGGDDALSGGAGSDVFVYRNLDEGVDSILDYSFADGDKLDLSGLLDSSFVTASSRIEDFVQLTQSGSDITVQVDADGAANGTAFAPVIVLVGCATEGNDQVMTLFGGEGQILSV